jgi:hypothetical protein
MILMTEMAVHVLCHPVSLNLIVGHRQATVLSIKTGVPESSAWLEIKTLLKQRNSAVFVSRSQERERESALSLRDSWGFHGGEDRIPHCV